MFRAVLVASFASAPVLAQETIIEFNRDVRPILSNNCFTCHGPDNHLRKADLRLDIDKDAFTDRGGYQVLVRGKPLESEFYKRLISTEKSEKMPPHKTNKVLTKTEIETLKTWIAQGAKYQKHWSLEPIGPIKAPLLTSPQQSPIDGWIQARLDQEKVKPSPEADRRTLLRRLSFDLTGLPPTAADVDAFLDDKSPDAYEKAVDRLLASKSFGERMALYWLDLVRYADSAGYHSDNHRDVYLYRDWVIDAFNNNMRFDQFTIEQLAGDLMPKATNSQRIASGYNRLLQTTEEGGAQAKEYQAKYYADRVRNFSTVWMGMTLGCAECHDHKFDPFTTKEFYRMVAFFADIKEKPVGRQEQTPIMTAAIEAKVQAVEQSMLPLQKKIAEAEPMLIKNLAKWEKEAKPTAAKTLPKEIAAILDVEPGKRNAKQKEALAVFYRGIDPEVKATNAQLVELQKQKDSLLKNVPQTLTSTSMTPRMIRVLPRGNWLDDSGEPVQSGTPASLPPLKAAGDKANRLDLARWVVAPENPLTARVFANRLWMLFLGQGLVKTLDDLGSQGTWPSHPELLDWLADDFRRDWDVKRAIKQILMTQAYKRSSQVNESVRARDPYNQLLASQARYRLDAEFVRDNALSIAGLLVDKVGGPSVKPYQPAGYWAYLNFPKREWMKDQGDSLYRRGLYTYWQRSFLHPSLLAFDASTREECSTERTKSNTPQQALVLLNDPTYVEAARAFAERILKNAGSADDRLQFAFRTALQRPARAEELKVLNGLLTQHQQQFAADPKSAESFLKIGDRPVPANVPAPELAAWTSVARVILNLHETITRN